MGVGRLVLREITFRKLNFSLGVLAVLAAVAVLVAARASLDRFQYHTEQVLAERQAQTRQEMDKLEDDFRKITKNMGFNVLILPKKQNLSDLYDQDFASEFMPEEYAERLAASHVATIAHLLPSLQQKRKWDEMERTILLVGVRGEVPLSKQDAKSPILEPVPAGTLTVGYELHRSLKLAAGQKVKLLGREFTVGKLNPERGTKDDITVWMNLKEAQELLHKEGQINAILALECSCATNRLGAIRVEIEAILPDTRVIEFSSQALGRAEARERAAQEAANALRRDEEGRTRLLAERESFAAALVPLVVAASAAWIALLAWTNVRERRREIGILRAVGWRAGQLLALLQIKAAALGLLGAVLGQGVGLLAESIFAGPGAAVPMLFRGGQFLAVLLLAPLLACLASWLPAFVAAQQDPAAVLRET